jgi:hypothetical protein
VTMIRGWLHLASDLCILLVNLRCFVPFSRLLLISTDVGFCVFVLVMATLSLQDSLHWQKTQVQQKCSVHILLGTSFRHTEWHPNDTSGTRHVSFNSTWCIVQRWQILAPSPTA